MNAIPEITDSLKDVNTILHNTLLNFPRLIETWRKRLKSIGLYTVVASLNDLEYHLEDGRGVDDVLMLAGSIEEQGNIITSSSDKTVKELAQEGVVLVYATYASREQYIAGGYWPDSISQRGGDPILLVAEFMLGDTARIRVMHSEGVPFWENIDFLGTWSEVFNRLVIMQERVAKELVVDWK